jgi:ribosome-associated heat shock protein Hsp15
MAEHPADAVRLDKWLWAARFFKTRQLAVEAINGGKVHLNGHRTKPGKEVRIGARLEIHKGELAWDIQVLGLSGRRGPAAEAQRLYEETVESAQRREQTLTQRRIERAAGPRPAARPTKRDRRLIHRFKQTTE